jgi:hypothetical protein
MTKRSDFQTVQDMWLNYSYWYENIHKPKKVKLKNVKVTVDPTVRTFIKYYD